MEGISGLEGSTSTQADFRYLEQAMGLRDQPEDESFSMPLAVNEQSENESLSTALAEKLEEWRKVLENEIEGTRRKWTEETARLLITAISYFLEASESRFMPLATKWKVVSAAMGEKGHRFSPQECQDKFKDIRTRYLQLIGLLGKTTSCNVVDNPILLDTIGFPERVKVEARKLLGSDQFLYREMCSLYHGNRLFLPHDWVLRKAMMSGIARYCDGRGRNDFFVERWVKMEAAKVEMQKQRVEMQKQRYDWLCLKYNEDIKIEKMRLENEKMRLKNARLAFEARRRELGVCGGNN